MNEMPFRNSSELEKRVKKAEYSEDKASSGNFIDYLAFHLLPALYFK